jgi:hypothetical protein
VSNYEYLPGHAVRLLVTRCVSPRPPAHPLKHPNSCAVEQPGEMGIGGRNVASALFCEPVILYRKEEAEGREHLNRIVFPGTASAVNWGKCGADYCCWHSASNAE